MKSGESNVKCVTSTMNCSLIRKFRKKLRQIEQLERLERELTEEEEIKIESKEDIRSELQELLSSKESEMVNLTDQIGKTSINIQSVQDMRDEKGSYIISGNKIKEEVEDHHNEENKLSGLTKNGVVEKIDASYANEVKSMNTANGENELGNDQDEDIKLNKDVVEKEIKNRKNENSDTISTKKGEDESKDEVSNENEGICNEKNDAIDLTITKKSLRQRNRVPHTTPHSDSPVLPKKVATHTRSIQSFFSDLIMEIKMLEGHYQDVCSVDLSSDYVVSGGRDTAIKLWSASSAEELKSVGGHTGTVTGVRFMKDKKFETYPKVVSGSYDCSIRTWDLENGTSLKCIYVYSPVVCLDYLDGKVAIGTEGGKVEVYNIDTGEQVLSVSAYEDAISAVKLLPDDKVASGSTDGILKIFDISITQLEPVFTLDPSQISIKGVSQVEDECTKPHNLLLSRISCITTWRDLVIYGDEGYNIKVLDYKKGEITKVRNNLQEFSPTESIYVSSVDGHDYLFSVGSDVDLGDAYINIRSLPDLKYFGTIRDTHSSTGPITSFCIQEVESCIRFVSGGQQLRVWEQISRRAKKRKSSSEEDCLIPCKFICNYTEARESEPDTDSDESEQSKSISEESVSVNESSEARSWCAIL